MDFLAKNYHVKRLVADCDQEGSNDQLPRYFISDGCAQMFADNPNLIELSLEGVSFDMKAIVNLTKIRSLETLNIIERYQLDSMIVITKADPAGMAILAQMPTLRDLKVTRFDQSSIKPFLENSHIEHLSCVYLNFIKHEYYLEDNQCTAVENVFLAELKKNKTLLKFDFKYSHYIDTAGKQKKVFYDETHPFRQKVNAILERNRKFIETNRRNFIEVIRLLMLPEMNTQQNDCGFYWLPKEIRTLIVNMVAWDLKALKKTKEQVDVFKMSFFEKSCTYKFSQPKPSEENPQTITSSIKVKSLRA